MPWFHNEQFGGATLGAKRRKEVTKSPKRKEGSFYCCWHSLHYSGIMNEEEVEQLSNLNRRVYNRETLTDQQAVLRANLGNLISRYLYIYIYI